LKSRMTKNKGQKEAMKCLFSTSLNRHFLAHPVYAMNSFWFNVRNLIFLSVCRIFIHLDFIFFSLFSTCIFLWISADENFFLVCKACDLDFLTSKLGEEKPMKEVKRLKSHLAKEKIASLKYSKSFIPPPHKIFFIVSKSLGLSSM